MSQMIVRNLDAAIKAGLKARALRHGWSVEEEVRQILRRAVNEAPSQSSGLGSRIASRFLEEGLQEPILEWRGHEAKPIVFDEGSFSTRTFFLR